MPTDRLVVAAADELEVVSYTSDEEVLACVDVSSWDEVELLGASE